MRANSLHSPLRVTLKLIDYFLVRANNFELAEYGLEAITTSDLKRLLLELSRQNSTSISVYQWPKQLLLFLHTKQVGFDYSKVLEDNPWLKRDIFCEGSFKLGISNDEAYMHRAFLWNAGFYNQTGVSSSQGDTSYKLNTRLLSREIYKNTLRGVCLHPVPMELDLRHASGPSRLYPPVFVKNMSNGKMKRRDMAKYGAGLINIVRQGVGLKRIHLPEIENTVTRLASEATPESRFSSLPHKVVMFALKGAIEFYLEYGGDIFNTYIELCKKKFGSKQVSKKDLLLSIKTPASQRLATNFKIRDRDFNSTPAGASRFLRKKVVSFQDLLAILFGALHIILGVLSARRMSELISLPIDKSLDPSESFLVFKNRKSGFHELRSRELRPIPPIAVRVLKDIWRFQSQLIKLNIIDNYVEPLARPRLDKIGLIKGSSIKNSYHLDVFCDFIDMPLNNEGRRYYIRSHQMRRFFAMAFFWSGTSVGPDTISHFMGHTDPRHLYRYISEDISGDVLRNVKASFTRDLLNENTELKNQISDLLSERFNVQKFSILTHDELSLYINSLVEDDTVSVEPIFYDSDEGKSYEICIKIADKEVIC
jgi:integrase